MHTSDISTQADQKGTDGKKIFHVNGNQKKAGVMTLKSVKTDFKTKTGLQAINARESVEKREHSYTVGGNTN